jgi:hypothetical protein
LSDAREDTIAIVCEGVEKSGAGNFGAHNELIGRTIPGDGLTFSTGGGGAVQGSFPLANCVSTKVKVGLNRRQLLVREAGELL